MIGDECCFGRHRRAKPEGSQTARAAILRFATSGCVEGSIPVPFDKSAAGMSFGNEHRRSRVAADSDRDDATKRR
jgi:hypothetical protein